jgi:hypothetical protein
MEALYDRAKKQVAKEKEMYPMSFLNGKKSRLILLGALMGTLLVAVVGMMTNINTAAAREVSSSKAIVYLKHTPYGLVDLKWNPKSEDLTVQIGLVGLAQNSTHPAHIHLGDCNSNGPVKYMLNNVVANAAGIGISTTVIKKVKGGIPATGWYINVHNGPGLKPAAQFIPIACANISNPHKANALRVRLGATSAPDQAVYGRAQLSLKDNILTVIVTVHGLVPGSKHAEHIHVGNCLYQVPGNVLYMLKNLVADKYGNATATTVIKNVKGIPANGWYVNVHRTTNLSTQTGFDPIACGNV